MVVERGKNRGEFPQGLQPLEMLHHPPPSAHGKVRILGAVVKVPTNLAIAHTNQLTHRCWAGFLAIGGDPVGPAVTCLPRQRPLFSNIEPSI
jgi:hypothetical protein